MPRANSGPRFHKLPANWRSDPGITAVGMVARAAFLELWTIAQEGDGEGILTEPQVRSVFPPKNRWKTVVEELVDAGLLLHDEQDGGRWVIMHRQRWNIGGGARVSDPSLTRSRPVADTYLTGSRPVSDRSSTGDRPVSDSYLRKDERPAQRGSEVQQRSSSMPPKTDRQRERKYPSPEGDGTGTFSARSAPRARMGAAAARRPGAVEPGSMPTDRVADDEDDYAEIPEDLKDVRGPALAREMLRRANENNPLYTGVRPKGFAPKRLNPFINQNSPDNFTPIKGGAL